MDEHPETELICANAFEHEVWRGRALRGQQVAVRIPFLRQCDSGLEIDLATNPGQTKRAACAALCLISN
ncbi:MAG: hypothetical protein QM776_12365 [Rhodocyclaceae bacterium]